MSRIVSTGVLVESPEHTEGKVVSVQGGYGPRLRTGYLVVFHGGHCLFNSQLDPETAGRPLTFEDLTLHADQRRIFASNRFWSALYDHVEGEVAEGTLEV